MAGEEAPVKFINEPSTHLRCPICDNIYNDPAIAVACGHSFCRQCAAAPSNKLCPLDKTDISSSALVVNRIVNNQIEDLLIHCRYGVAFNSSGVWVVDASGCKEEITLGRRAHHESQCSFGSLPCPNSLQHCGKFRQADLPQHLCICSHTPCMNADKGCEFTSTKEGVLEHRKICGYRGFQRSSVHLEEDVHQLLGVNADLKNEVTELTDKLGKQELENRALKTEVSKNSSQIQMLQKKYDSLQSALEVLQRIVSKSPSAAATTTTVERSKSASREKRSPSVSSLSSPPGKRRDEKWEMPFTFKCIGTFRGHRNTVFCTATHKQKLYSSGADGELKIWDLDRLSLGCVKTLKGHSKTVHTLAVSHGCLYSAGEDFSIRMWRLDTAEEYKTLENAHENFICAMAISNDHVFTSSHSMIKVWDCKTLAHVHSMSGLYHWVRALTLDPSKELLYSGSHNTIDIWDATGKFHTEGKIEHEFGSVYSLSITQDYLIAGTYNKNIQLFDVKTRTHVRSLAGHISTVSSVLASPSGRYLFSCSYDKTVQVWSLENMLPIQSLSRHDGAVNCLSLRGDYLISGSEDTEIKIYKYFQMQIGI